MMCESGPKDVIECGWNVAGLQRLNDCIDELNNLIDFMKTRGMEVACGACNQVWDIADIEMYINGLIELKDVRRVEKGCY